MSDLYPGFAPGGGPIYSAPVAAATERSFMSASGTGESTEWVTAEAVRGMIGLGPTDSPTFGGLTVDGDVEPLLDNGGNLGTELRRWTRLRVASAVYSPAITNPVGSMVVGQSDRSTFVRGGAIYLDPSGNLSDAIRVNAHAIQPYNGATMNAGSTSDPFVDVFGIRGNFSGAVRTPDLYSTDNELKLGIKWDYNDTEYGLLKLGTSGAVFQQLSGSHTFQIQPGASNNRTILKSSAISDYRATAHEFYGTDGVTPGTIKAKAIDLPTGQGASGFGLSFEGGASGIYHSGRAYAHHNGEAVFQWDSAGIATPATKGYNFTRSAGSVIDGVLRSETAGEVSFINGNGDLGQINASALESDVTLSLKSPERVALVVNGTTAVSATASGVYTNRLFAPTVSGTVDLGNANYKFRDATLSGLLTVDRISDNPSLGSGAYGNLVMSGDAWIYGSNPMIRFGGSYTAAGGIAGAVTSDTKIIGYKSGAGDYGIDFQVGGSSESAMRIAGDKTATFSGTVNANALTNTTGTLVMRGQTGSYLNVAGVNVLLASSGSITTTKDIIPNADGTIENGQAAKRWSVVNAVDGDFSGTVVASGSIQSGKMIVEASATNSPVTYQLNRAGTRQAFCQLIHSTASSSGRDEWTFVHEYGDLLFKTGLSGGESDTLRLQSDGKINGYGPVHIKNSAGGGSVPTNNDFLSIEDGTNNYINLITGPTKQCGMLFSDNTRATASVIYNHANNLLSVTAPNTSFSGPIETKTLNLQNASSETVINSRNTDGSAWTDMRLKAANIMIDPQGGQFNVGGLTYSEAGSQGDLLKSGNLKVGGGSSFALFQSGSVFDLYSGNAHVLRGYPSTTKCISIGAVFNPLATLHVGGDQIIDDALRVDGNLGLFGVTPVAQQTALGITAGHVAGAGASVSVDSTHTGNFGSSAYTFGDLVAAFKNLGALTI